METYYTRLSHLTLGELLNRWHTQRNRVEGREAADEVLRRIWDGRLEAKVPAPPRKL